ncbi:ABC transporter ATP-binding protein [Tissierella praeacuta]|uniref:ABC transporter ATP-binding protein n=1 Tax=Tissierella praeacuta TaxID=43131 RepID=UPI001C1044CC|nr:ABC transporter ATP-binding protein [Tissierella praeacuta]MBU5256287.1 ABC transporter ATP-binding protein/permease [Tissierella praeacuta]
MFKEVKALLGEDRKKLRRPICFTILDSFFNMFIYGMLYKVLMDLMDKKLSLEKIKIYGLIMIIGFLARATVVSLSYSEFNIEGAKIIKNMRLNLGDHLRHLNLGYFNKNSIGDLSNIMTNDIQDFEKVITHNVGDLIKTMSLSIYIILISFIIDRGLALTQLTILIIGAPLLYMAGLKANSIGKKKKAAMNEVISRMVEYLNGIKLFKAYNLVGKKFERLESSFRSLKKESIKFEIRVVPFIFAYMIVIDISFPIVLFLGTKRLLAGTISSKSFLTFMIISLTLTNVLKAFSRVYAEFKFFKLAAQKLSNTYSQSKTNYKYEDIDFENYDIEFKGVSFEYEEGESTLKDINFTAKEGTMTALIGPSGSGKTTITSLIARFWDVNKGEVTVGNKDIKDINPETLLSHISMVFQDVYLLNDTIYNNIKIGNQDANYNEVIEAAKIANCHEFIEKLPQGYETIVGEGGSTLSGGEKQRISIARAILKDAEIILLDEATASLDADNEMEIRKSIDKLTDNKTVIVIAHRLNTIKDAEQIIVLNEGKIEEKGNHEELMKNKKRYYNMLQEMERAKSWAI